MAHLKSLTAAPLASFCILLTSHIASATPTVILSDGGGTVHAEGSVFNSLNERIHIQSQSYNFAGPLAAMQQPYHIDLDWNQSGAAYAVDVIKSPGSITTAAASLGGGGLYHYELLAEVDLHWLFRVKNDDVDFTAQYDAAGASCELVLYDLTADLEIINWSSSFGHDSGGYVLANGHTYTLDYSSRAYTTAGDPMGNAAFSFGGAIIVPEPASGFFLVLGLVAILRRITDKVL